MALYLTNFKRINFSFGDNNLLNQSVDILFEYDGEINENINEEDMELIHNKAFTELFEQFPTWREHSLPKYCTKGWSSIIGPYTFKKIK